jgi:hypothetical protein
MRLWEAVASENNGDLQSDISSSRKEGEINEIEGNGRDRSH